MGFAVDLAIDGLTADHMLITQAYDLVILSIWDCGH